MKRTVRSSLFLLLTALVISALTLTGCGGGGVAAVPRRPTASL